MTARKITAENWRADYDKKLVSAKEAAKLVKSGDNIFIPAVYLGFLPHAIAARKDELRDVTVEVQAPVFDPGWLAPGMEDSFQVIARIFMAALARPGHDEGRIQFLPYTNGAWFKTHRERAEELITVAHPDFRDELSESAKDIY